MIQAEGKRATCRDAAVRRIIPSNGSAVPAAAAGLTAECYMTRSSRQSGNEGRRCLARQAAAAAVLLVTALPSHALGLGAPEVASNLGQPFQMRVPVLGDDAPDLVAECVQVLAERGDLTIPAVAGVRIRVARSATRTVILVTSDRPVNEPAARVVLRAGCGDSPVEREFVILLDPPVVGAQLAAAPVEAPEAAPAAPRPDAPPAAAPAPTEGRARLEVVPRAPAPERLPSATPGSAAETRRVAPVAPGPVSKAPASAPRRDRLKIVEPDARPPRELAASTAPASAVGAPSAPGSSAPGGTVGSVAPSAAAGTVGAAAAGPEVQAQLTALASQMADLRRQLDTVSQRNRELSQAADRGVWGWIAAGVLGVALLLLVWVYAQTRRRELHLLAMESDLEGRMAAVQPASGAAIGGALSASAAGAGAAAVGLSGAVGAGSRPAEVVAAQPVAPRVAEPRAERNDGDRIEVTEITHPATEPGFPRETPPTQPAPDPDFPRTRPPASAIPRTLDAYAQESAERRHDGTPLDIDLSAPASPAKPRVTVLRDSAAAGAPTKTGVDFDLDPPTNVRR